MTPLIATLYTATLAGLALYAVHIIILMVLYLWHRRRPAPPLPKISDADLPTVTIQVPLRNEPYVVQRILQAIANLDWPRDRLDLQILDDSNDETTDLIREEIQHLHTQNINVQLLHRKHPIGHKAGALAAGLMQTRSTYVAIFDADFRPSSDFLRQTVPHLIVNDTLGMVQARWGHLNAEYSAITRAQALLLDAHFTVDHIARNRAGLPMNFNGTAGVWRKKTIDDAGGWQSDTVAEDLDLSYRAQLRGWKMLYLPEVVAPAEIPPLISAFKQQQYRWAKGAAQCLRKLIGPVLLSPHLKWHQKAMAILHLSGYLSEALFLLLLLLSLPMAIYAPHLPALVAFLGTVTTIPPILYLLGQTAHYRDWPRRILYYPILMILGLGITWSTTTALLDGFLHWGGDFARTPKFRLEGQQKPHPASKHYHQNTHNIGGEIILALYALVSGLLAYRTKQFDLVFFDTVCFAGLLLIIYGKIQRRP